MPDLAFSEMEFLQRAKLGPSKMKGKDAHLQSQERESRKKEHAQAEISSFFTTKKAALPEINVYPKRAATSTHRDSKDQKHRSRRRKHQETGSRISLSISQSLDFHENPFLGLGSRASSPEKISVTSHFPRQVLNSHDPIDSLSHNYSKDTTKCSWWNSSKSPNVLGLEERRASSSRPAVSTTPVSVRRSLESTGIFDATGINRDVGRPQHADSPQVFNGPQSDSHGTLTDEPRRVADGAGQSTPRTEALSRIQNEPIWSPQGYGSRDSEELHLTDEQGRGTENHQGNFESHGKTKGKFLDADRPGDSRNLQFAKTIVGRHYSGQGWHKHTGGASRRFSHQNPVPKEVVGGYSRQDLAQEAYVKRLSNTKSIPKGQHNPEVCTINPEHPMPDYAHLVHRKDSRLAVLEQCDPSTLDLNGQADSPGTEKASCEGNYNYQVSKVQSSSIDTSMAPLRNNLSTLQKNTAPTNAATETLQNNGAPIDRGIQDAKGRGIENRPEISPIRDKRSDQPIFRDFLVRRGFRPRTAALTACMPWTISPSVQIEPLYMRQLETWERGELEHAYQDIPLLEAQAQRSNKQDNSFEMDQLSQSIEYECFDQEYLDDLASIEDETGLSNEIPHTDEYQVEERTFFEASDVLHISSYPHTGAQSELNPRPNLEDTYIGQLTAIPGEPDQVTQDYQQLYLHYGIPTIVEPDIHDEVTLGRFWRPQRRY